MGVCTAPANKTNLRRSHKTRTKYYNIHSRSVHIILIFKMVKLNVDLIQGAAQYINPIRERELDLRGYKIPIIENLGATLDQFDTIDFSDNEVRRLDNFPVLPRLKALHFNNNNYA